MVEDYGLSEVWMPEDGTTESTLKCDIYMSPEFRLDANRESYQAKKAVVLI